MLTTWCLQAMNAYAAERKAFGEPLHAFGQIQRHLAESYAEYMAGKHYLYQVMHTHTHTLYHTHTLPLPGDASSRPPDPTLALGRTAPSPWAQP